MDRCVAFGRIAPADRQLGMDLVTHGAAAAHRSRRCRSVMACSRQPRRGLPDMDVIVEVVPGGDFASARPKRTHAGRGDAQRECVGGARHVWCGAEHLMPPTLVGSSAKMLGIIGRGRVEFRTWWPVRLGRRRAIVPLLGWSTALPKTSALEGPVEIGHRADLDARSSDELPVAAACRFTTDALRTRTPSPAIP